MVTNIAFCWEFNLGLIIFSVVNDSQNRLTL